jgi:hypothetical protein
MSTKKNEDITIYSESANYEYKESRSPRISETITTNAKSKSYLTLVTLKPKEIASPKQPLTCQVVQPPEGSASNQATFRNDTSNRVVS